MSHENGHADVSFNNNAAPQFRLSESALRHIPDAEALVMDGGQYIPLQSHHGSRTTTTMRQARIKGQAYDAGKAENFRVGMDINLIIREIHQNTLRHMCIADEDRSRLFADPEVRILAAALDGNTSIITLRIPGCHATDVSLVPLYKALARHPTIRSLDVSDTKGTEVAGKELANLVCKNTNIVHVERKNIRIKPNDAALLEEALCYKCFNCQDPGKNPYDASLIKYIDVTGKEERTINEQVNIKNPWMYDPETGEVQLHVLENLARLYAPTPAVADEGTSATADTLTKKKRKKKATVSFGAEPEFEVHRQVCDDYMNGSCRYGSRCKYLHPERTSASMNRVIAVKAQEEAEMAEEEHLRLQNDDRTTIASRVSTARSKLRGRTKAVFKFDSKKIPKSNSGLGHDASRQDNPSDSQRPPSDIPWPIVGSSLVIMAAACIAIKYL